jgi:hypothetical protein
MFLLRFNNIFFHEDINHHSGADGKAEHEEQNPWFIQLIQPNQNNSKQTKAGIQHCYEIVKKVGTVFNKTNDPNGAGDETSGKSEEESGIDQECKGKFVSGLLLWSLAHDEHHEYPDTDDG